MFNEAFKKSETKDIFSSNWENSKTKENAQYIYI